MDRELLYNKSGIKDETAYKAILRSGGGTGRMKNYEINKGEIWEVDNNGSTRVVVILACFERYAATVMLQEQEPGSNAVAVRVRDIMYADAGRLGYVFYDKMVDFVRALSEEEDYELRRAIAEALVLPDDEAPLDSMATDANREIDGLKYEIAQLRQQLKEKAEEAEKAQEDLHYLGKAGRTGSRTTGRQRSVFRRQDTKQAVHQKDTGRRTGVYDLGSKRQ